MNISQLSAFHAVMTSSTMTEAADRLGRTQPAISAAIKSLEDQLDMQLFERRGRKLVPMPEAKYLLTEAADILTRLAQVRQTMRGLGDGQLGSLNVAAMPGPVAMLFPRFISRHVSRLKRIKVSMLARSSGQITELARAQSIDFGFADLPQDPDGGGLYHSSIITGDCFVALPKGHALAGQDAISLDMLNTEPMGSLQSTHPHTQDVQKAFEQEGCQFNRMVESQTFLPILQFIVAGQCCAILDPLTVTHIRDTQALRQGLTIRPLAEPLRYSYAIISPTHRPISVTAAGTRDAWAGEVEQFLHTLGARPEWMDQERSAKASS